MSKRKKRPRIPQEEKIKRLEKADIEKRKLRKEEEKVDQEFLKK